MVRTYQEELQARREACKEVRALFERIANLIGAKVDSTTITSVEIDDNFFISVFQKPKNVHISLVRNLHQPCGRGNFRVDFITLKPDASDKKILNAYNKLIKEAKEIEL